MRIPVHMYPLSHLRASRFAMDRPAYTVLPLERADIPALIAIGAAAFVDDRHTRMKMHEKGTTDLAAELEPRESVEAAWGRPGVHMFKAVDGEGRMVGYSSWREWNFGKDVAVSLAGRSFRGTDRSRGLTQRRSRRQSRLLLFSLPRSRSSGSRLRRADTCAP